MNKSLLSKYIYGLAYILLTMVFLVIFNQITAELRVFAVGRFDHTAMIPSIIFTFIFSIVMSWEYIKNLFLQKGKIKINFSKLIMAIILFVLLHLVYFAHSQLPLQLNFLLTALTRPYGFFSFFFMLWFNLIRVLKTS